MKRIAYLVLVIVFATACKEKKHGAFVIKGEVLHATGKKVMLMETPPYDQPVILDSAFLQGKGTFTLKGRANEEGIYRIVVEKGPDVVLVNDNNEINLHLDVDDYRNYTTEGSAASESLHKLFEDYRSKDSLIATNFKHIDSIQKVPGNDSLVEIMRTANDRQIESLNNLLRDFIKNNNSPAAVLYVLGEASREMKGDELKTLTDATAARFPGHSGFARIKAIAASKKEEVAAAKPPEAASSLEGKPAPDLAMNGINGKPISISSFKGKFLLVDFWASWCGPCRQENPNVVLAYNRFKNKNFTILGVSLDDNKEAWQAAIAKDNLAWNHMSDLKHWQSAAVAAYGFEGIPFNVLIDPSGKIIASGLRGDDLEKKLEEVLK